MKAHSLAKYFPILEGEEFELLVEDIKKNGQLEPIVTVNGEILDGINRYRACQKLGIEPLTEEYQGDDPLGYVISINIRRRHMDVSQRAMLATEMLPEFEKAVKEREAIRKSEDAKKKRPEGSKLFISGLGSKDPSIDKEKEVQRSRDDAGKQFGVSGSSIKRAKRIKEQAPNKVNDIIAGKTTVNIVDTELREKAELKRQKVKYEKEAKKIPNERPKIVKDYLEKAKELQDILGLAIKAKKQGMFSPEAMRFTIKRNEEIRRLMAELEGEDL